MNGVPIAGYFFVWVVEVEQPFVSAVVLHGDLWYRTGRIIICYNEGTMHVVSGRIRRKN